MNINLYKFSKRNNSTKRPTGTGTQFSCYLKEPTSVVTPTIVTETTSNTFPDYNYAYIATFGRYYYITDIVSDGNLWYISCITDVLATYKTEIGNTDLYVLRSASDSNGKLMDMLYPALADYVVDRQTSVAYKTTQQKATPWEFNVQSGCFILGVMSNDASMGNIKYIAMNYSNMRSLCATLATDAVTSNNGFTDIINQIGQAMTKQLVDPLQYIKSANWIPLPYSTFASITAETTLNTGYLSFSGFEFKTLPSDGYWFGSLLAFQLNSHPQASRGSYLNSSPYTDRYLFAPPFGIIPLQNQNLVGNSYIAVNYRIDYITCAGDIFVYGTDDPDINNLNLSQNLITHITAQVGVPVTMTQAVRDYLGGITSAMQLAAGAASLDFGLIGGGIISSLASAQPRYSSVGGTGGIAGIAGSWALYSVFTKIADEHLEDIGRPLCKVKKPSALSGFIQARSGDVSISGTAGEQAEIANYLEKGFFYE